MPKILAIDDKMDNLITLSAVLKSMMPDCSITTALSGLEGIDKARSESPDVVLLDVKMPGMDGFETCRQLKTNEITKRISVIMITAIKTDHQSRIKGMEIGADAFLSKPIDESELVSQVKVALRSKQAEDALRIERDSLEKTVQERTAHLLQEVADRKRAEEALRLSEKRYRDLSIIDDLTQLYNSRYFYQQLKMEIDRSDRYGQPLTLLLLDLDGFKTFNDSYGHIEGDQVLRRLGEIMKRCLRQTDSAYRYGGEEFTIILPMTTSADGIVAAERIRAELKEENFSPDPDKIVNMTVSTGVAQQKPLEEMKAFVYRVDQLMYRGKKNGKDSVCSDP